MIFRLSTKLAMKLKEPLPTKVLQLDPNPFADWSAHLFTADRTQYVIVTNSISLYSVVMYGSGITHASRFIERAMSSLRELMEDDGQSFIYQRFIVPSSGNVHFSKALNRSVTGSLNDLVIHAKMWLTDRELSPQESGFMLNEIPFASLEYRNPKEVFKSQTTDQDDSGGE